MANVQEQIAQAKAAGYSDADIAKHLAAKPEYAPKFQTALSAGYKPEEIISHLSGASAEQPKEETKLDMLKNWAGGGLRGAGSIGATALAPIDMYNDYKAGKGLSLESNRARRADMDHALRDMGVNTDSGLFQVGKLASEVAGTSGTGKLLGMGAEALGASPAIVNSLTTGGMQTGGAPGLLNMLTRVGGGAVTGGVSAGQIDPSQAGMGALIGGAAPPVVSGLGWAGNKIGNALSPTVPPAVQQGVAKAREAGYVIPPSQAKPTLGNRLLEGFAGKITTAQNASAKNQAITQDLIASELGIPKGQPLSVDALKSIRQQAGQAYDAVGSTGTINTTPSYNAALDDIMASAKKAATGFPNAKANPLIAEIESLKTPQMDASSAIAKIKELREAADAAYRAGNKELGKALKSGSAAIEDAIEAHLKSINADPGLLDGFRSARQLIAKTYSVEKAMNATSGNVDAAKLGQQLAKGKPLSGGIRTAAEFAQQFPKAAQSVEKMGSLPQISPLDWSSAGIVSGVTANPLMMAGVLARPAARAAVLSGPVQNRLATAPMQFGSGFNALLNPDVQQGIARLAPGLVASR